MRKLALLFLITIAGCQVSYARVRDWDIGTERTASPGQVILTSVVTGNGTTWIQSGRTTTYHPSSEKRLRIGAGTTETLVIDIINATGSELHFKITGLGEGSASTLAGSRYVGPSRDAVRAWRRRCGRVRTRRGWWGRCSCEWFA